MPEQAADGSAEPGGARPPGRRRADRRRPAGDPGTGRPDARARRIDETLTRLTAAHAGVTLGGETAPAPAGARRRLTPTALVALLAAVLVVLVSGTGWVSRAWLAGSVRPAGALDPASDAVRDPAAQAGDVNLLVLANDEPDPAGRRDASTLVLTHVPEGGGPVTAVAIPPDLEINRPPCERWDAAAAAYRGEIVPAETLTTLATAYVVGGPRCTVRVVQQITGIAVTGFAAVDLSAAAALVDAVGGVEVCVERPVTDASFGVLVPDAGPERLDGRRAGALVRAGQVRGEPAPARAAVQRQHRVLAAALGSALSTGGLLDLGRVGEVSAALGSALLTDGVDVGGLLAASRTLSRLDAEGVVFAPVPLRPTETPRGHVALADAESAGLFAALRQDTALPEGAIGPDVPPAGPAPAEVRLDVLNASERPGVAGEVASTLAELGFGVGEVGNAPGPARDTVVRHAPDQAEAAAVVAAAVPSAAAVADPTAQDGTLQLVLGASFDGTVRATAAEAAPAPAAPPVACG